MHQLIKRANLYGTTLDVASNSVYVSIYAILAAYYVLMCIKSRYWWFNISFSCGYVMELIGFIGRIIAINDLTNESFFIMQNFCLTVAPAFIMAGVYFLFGQVAVIYGRKFSLLRPIWYSYFFITIDVVTLLVQATGGAISSVNNSEDVGKGIMIGGIALQVVAMTIFLTCWFYFWFQVFFKCSSTEKNRSHLVNRTFLNYLRLLFNVPSTRGYKANYLDEFYDPSFIEIRRRPLFNWIPLAVTVAVVAIYIRCVYRVVELSQGWLGYLMVHEVFLMVLDAAMISIAGLIFVPFHPYWVFGKENLLKYKVIKQKNVKT